MAGSDCSEGGSGSAALLLIYPVIWVLFSRTCGIAAEAVESARVGGSGSVEAYAGVCSPRSLPLGRKPTADVGC